MCGIAGVLLPKGQVPDQETLLKLQEGLRHRGPDDAGHKIIDNVALVHTRLSIIDVAGGHQPLEKGEDLCLVMNGEIYNYVELQEKYASYPFTTRSDSETALPVYEDVGATHLTQHLRGMYGLCLVDRTKNIAVLARDPYGIKPLYYVHLEGGGIAFASEAAPLVMAGFAKAMINPHARAQSLQLGFGVGTDTAVGFIKRVMPGETLIIEDGAIVQRFQDTLPAFAAKKRSQASLLAELDEVLRDSVRVHLRSDVPYGLFLSGGLDSATLLKLMSEESGTQVRTYSIGFSGTQVHDERDQARLMARHFNSAHHELDYTQDDFWKTLPLVAKACDDLMFDQAMLPTFKLASFAAKDLKVVLSGEGGDEMFAGYRRYQKVRLPWFLGGGKNRTKGFIDRMKVGSYHLEDWRDAYGDLEGELKEQRLSKLDLAQRLDQMTWLPNDLLVKLDRCLMAHGLEGRTPFLDPVVGAFCASLPENDRVQGRYGKWILRKWLEKNLPESAPFAKKRGFRVPVGEWIASKGHRLGTLVSRQEGVAEIMDKHDVQSLFAQNDDRALFAAWELLFYALWYRIHIQGKEVIPDTLAMLSQGA